MFIDLFYLGNPDFIIKNGHARLSMAKDQFLPTGARVHVGLMRGFAFEEATVDAPDAVVIPLGAQVNRFEAEMADEPIEPILFHYSPF